MFSVPRKSKSIYHVQDYYHVSFVGDWNIILNQFFNTSGYLHENHLKYQQYIPDQMTVK